MHEDRLLTTEQAAELLSVHIETVRRLARRGEIPRFKVGRSWRFRSSALQRWAEQQASPEPRQASATRQRLLIVDDDELLCLGLARMLHKQRFDIQWSTEGEAGLRLVEEHQPHAILLDLAMPGMDGPTFLARLRERHPTLPVVIVTGHPEGELMLRAMQHPPVLLLAKPVVTDLLMRTLCTVLDSEPSLAKERAR
jgi:excisionase family DNA binding protein